MKRSLATGLAAAILCGGVPASAQVPTSAYTSLDLTACTARPIDPRDELQSQIWDCMGYAGIPVMVAESDLRFSVNYGVAGEAEIGWGQTLPPFNSIGETLEWRLDAGGTPVATILRYFTDAGDGGPQGQVLVVTRVQSPVCHVAYVNALANENANDLARQAAELIAPGFNCDYHAVMWVGLGGQTF